MLHCHILENVDNAKDPGVSISIFFSKETNVDNILFYVLKTLGFLRCNLQNCTKDVLFTTD